MLPVNDCLRISRVVQDPKIQTCENIHSSSEHIGNAGPATCVWCEFEQVNISKLLFLRLQHGSINHSEKSYHTP